MNNEIKKAILEIFAVLSSLTIVFLVADLCADILSFFAFTFSMKEIVYGALLDRIQDVIIIIIVMGYLS